MKYRVLLTVFMCLAIVTGCSAGKVRMSDVRESTIGINGDGTVSEVVIESFDQDYYSLSELTDYVNEQVDVFNQANPQEQPENRKADAGEITAVTVQDVSEDTEEKTARLALDYLNMDVYNLFNGTGLEFLDMEEAVLDERIAALADLISVKTGEEIAFSEIADSENLHVICTDEPLRIRTGGKIVYYSKAVSLIDAKTVLTADGQSVIVFK